MSTKKKPNHFDHLLQVFKKSLWTLFLYTFFYVFLSFFSRVYRPGAGADNALGSKFWSQEKDFITLTICCKLKKNLFQLWFYTYFWIILHMYIALGQGQTNIWGQNFYVNRKALSFWLFVASFKKITLKSDFIHIFFFHFFIHVYSPRQGADNPLVTKFWRQHKAQITLTICCKFQNDLFEFWFYTHFLIILYTYITSGQGQTNLWGQNFDVNRKLLPLRPFPASLIKSLRILILFTFFNIFPHVYSPGRGRQPFVDKILMSTERHCHFAHVLLVSNKYLWNLILYIFLPVFIYVYSPGADNPLWSEFLCKHTLHVTHLL